MHTARLLAVSPTAGRGCLLPGGRGVSAPGGAAWSWGGAWSWRLPGPRGCLLRGVPGPAGGVSQYALRQTPPVNRILDTRF